MLFAVGKTLAGAVKEGAIAAKESRSPLANLARRRFCSAFLSGHLSKEVLHSLYEERAFQTGYAVRGEKGILPTLWTRKALPNRAFGQFLDALPTIVVHAGQEFGVAVVILAYQARDLGLQFFQRLAGGSFRLSLGRHVPPTIIPTAKAAPRADRTPIAREYVIAHASKYASGIKKN